MRNDEQTKSDEVLKHMFLDPDQIITLNDFPVYSNDVLKSYFEMDRKGYDLPPILVMKLDKVKDLLPEKELDDFTKKHPKAIYFMMDGSHRTTVRTLSSEQIPVVVISSDNDVKMALDLVEKGEIYGLPIANTFSGCVNNLADHFINNPSFQTVLEKTQRMVDEKVIPQYMIDNYRVSRNK